MASPVQIRKLTKSCRRHPVVVLAILGLITYISIFFTGKEKWERLEPIPYATLKPDLFMQVSNPSGLKSQRQPVPPPHVVSDPDHFYADQEQRRAQIKQICSGPGRPIGLVNTLITKSNLTYCVIPRSSNTFWLQIFRYINYDYLEDRPKSPFDLNIQQVHERPFAKTRLYRWQHLPKAEKSALLASKIFLAVQDPYMRLWTTYLHTLVLPELWFTTGTKIEQKRKVEPGVAGVFQRKHINKLCGSEVTFPEFLEFVLSSSEAQFDTYYHQCDPCQLNPTYIIKSETAWRDSLHVLKHLGLSWAVEQPGLQEEVTKRYIRSTVLGAFDRMKDRRLQSCTTHGDIGRKLWKLFLLQGLIPEDAQQMPMEDMIPSALAQRVWEIHLSSKTQGLQVQAQRRKFMTAAFKHLKLPTLQAVQTKFMQDFVLFGYDPSPADIYMT